MRSLKFRAWDDQEKEMVYPAEFVEYAESRWELLDNFEDEDIMQFTWLIDKDGKEIYENDILQFQWLDTKFQVSYYTEYGQYRMSWVMYGKSENFPIFSNLVKIIWNVYENPSE